MPALIAAAGQIVTGTIDTLSKNKVYKAQVSKLQLEEKLAGLDSTQQFLLAQQLNEAKSDNERFAILKDRAARIDVALVESTGQYGVEVIKQRGKEAQTTAIIIGSAVILLIVAFVVIYRRK
jgi:hypothetical protein